MIPKIKIALFKENNNIDTIFIDCNEAGLLNINSALKQLSKQERQNIKLNHIEGVDTTINLPITIYLSENKKTIDYYNWAISKNDLSFLLKEIHKMHSAMQQIEISNYLNPIGFNVVLALNAFDDIFWNEHVENNFNIVRGVDLQLAGSYALGVKKWWLGILLLLIIIILSYIYLNFM